MARDKTLFLSLIPLFPTAAFFSYIHEAQAAEQAATVNIPEFNPIVTPEQVVNAILIILALSSLLLLWLCYLRRRVKASTEELGDANKALVESEERYRSLFENAPVGVFLADEQARIYDANKRATEITGFSKEELLTFSASDIIHPDSEKISPLEQVTERSLHQGCVIYERLYKTSEGPPVPVEVSLHVSKDKQHHMVMFQDITTRKAAQEALRESEQSLATIVRAAPVGIGKLKNRRIMSVNHKLCEIVGYEAEELIGMQTSPLYVSGEEYERVGKELYSRIRQGGIGMCEARFVRADGAIIDVLINAASSNPEEEDPEMVFTVQDITDKKEREEIFRQLFEQANDAILLLDAETGAFVECNQKAVELYDTPLERLIGSTPMDFSAPTMPDGSRSSVTAMDYIRGAAAGTPQHFEWRHFRGDGMVVDVEIGLSAIRRSGRDYVIAIVRDITDRKRTMDELARSEEQFRRLVEDMGDRFCLYRYDMEGKLTYLSPGVKPIFGSPANTYIGSTWSEVFQWNQDQLAQARRISGELVRGELDSATYEIGFTAPDGRYIVLENTKHALFDDNGAPVGFEGIVMDISERKQAEEELLNHKDHLEELVDQRTQELSDMVIELKHRHQESDIVTRLGDLLNACEACSESYSILTAACERLFRGDAGFLGMIEDGSDVIVGVSGFGGLDHEAQEFQMNRCWALRRSKSHIVSDPATDPVCPHLEGETDVPGMCIPLSARGEIIGLLHLRLDSCRNLPPEERDRAAKNKPRLAERVAELYSLSLSNLLLRGKLREQSIIDPLTHLYNRRYMQEALARELDRARRRERNVGVALMDVDHFKRFNDTYGHEAGDEVLRRLGIYLKDSVRGEDIACRYGGEELLVIFTDCPSSECRDRTEALRKGIEALPIRYNGEELGVTVSIGMACFPENGLSTEDLITMADTALYTAKNNGRNQVAHARPG